jgi:hypothetical protein
MSCNCKTQTEQYSVKSDVKLNKKITNYTLRSLVFLVSLIFLPIILIASIWFMFRTLVLDKEVDIIAIVSLIGNLFTRNKDDDDDDDDMEEDYNEDDYELIDIDYIKDKTN